MRFFLVGLFLCSGCAVLHHAQMGDIDDTGSYVLRPFNLMVSEVGINLDEAESIGKAMTTNQQARDTMQTINTIISLFQQGPVTGNPVYNDKYAQMLVHDIYKECPSGRITGVVSVRETRKYPVISGEIVKIRAYCKEKKS